MILSHLGVKPAAFSSVERATHDTNALLNAHQLQRVTEQQQALFVRIHAAQVARKAIDDIMGGSEAWKNADQTDATCPKCEAHRAYYQQLQIRSADEPMTTFYRCVSCGHNWREDG